MNSGNGGNDNIALEMSRLALERYKAKLDFWKFVLISGFAAVVITAIPPLFQYATAYLEYTKSEAARLTSAQQFRDGYVKEFLNTALTQDIEVRIRFAKYFSSVSSDKAGWAAYLDDLTKFRDKKRGEIDQLELDWHKITDLPRANAQEVNRLKRHLDWAYSEVGYVAPNRSAIANPRAPDEARGPGLSLASIAPGRRDIAQKIIDAFAAAGFGQFQQVAALANAIAESGLNPDATLANEDSWGLFLLSRRGGFGAGRTPDELKNPDINISIIVNEAKKVPAFAAAASLDEAVEIFVRRIERPANPNAEIVRRQQLARQLFRT